MNASFLYASPHSQTASDQFSQARLKLGIYDSSRLLPDSAGLATLCAHEVARRRRSQPLTTEPWVSVDEVATHLGVAKDSVYRWIEGRRLPAHRIGRLWKFKLSEVDEWVRLGGAKESDSQEGGAS